MEKKELGDKVNRLIEKLLKLSEKNESKHTNLDELTRNLDAGYTIRR